MPLVLAHDACAFDRIVDLRIGGIDVGGQRALLQHPFGRIPKAGGTVVRGDAEPPARLSVNQCASLTEAAFSGLLGDDQRFVLPVGLPSVRQNSENAQRGSGSPGYHLPWPMMNEPAGGKAVAQAPDQLIGQMRLVGPTAAMFHSADW